MKKFKAQSQRVLELMINSVYTNKEIFLRELISNASDAIDKAHFLSLTDPSLSGDYKIEIALDKDERTITVSDNGVGMTEKELEDNLSTIAASGTGEFKQKNETDSLIGQFGVGFYSAFMVADRIEVSTKSGDEAHLWVSDGTGYEITPCAKAERGTKVVLHIKEQSEEYYYDTFLEQAEIERIIKKYSDYIRYPIQMQVTRTRFTKDNSGKEEPVTTTQVETLNSMIPLWKKGKDATDEELNSFYSNKFGDYSPPLKSVHSRVEGAVSYDALLFFPSRAPFDFFTPTYERGISLYCNGVMIMDNCKELIGEHLGFVRGVVDSADLSLNISREVIQHSGKLRAIAKSIEKKVLSTMDSMLKNEREKYDALFDVFGACIKYGVYAEYGAKKDELKDLIMFYSSRTQKYTTLGEYVAQNSDKDAILYAAGPDHASIERLPVFAAAVEKGYEVLYFTDKIDEFVARIIDEYNGKHIRSITDSKFVLSDTPPSQSADPESVDLLAKIKECLGGKVGKVVLSNKLTHHAVCLTSEGDVTLEMERVLTSFNKENKVTATKVLELNPTHPVYEGLKRIAGDTQKLTTAATLLYSEAQLLGGMELSDISGFAEAINKIIE